MEYCIIEKSTLLITRISFKAYPLPASIIINHWEEPTPIREWSLIKPGGAHVQYSHHRLFQIQGNGFCLVFVFKQAQDVVWYIQMLTPRQKRLNCIYELWRGQKRFCVEHNNMKPKNIYKHGDAEFPYRLNAVPASLTIKRVVILPSPRDERRVSYRRGGHA